MAINKEGILGPFSGKVGLVVGTSWRGISVVRSLPSKSDKPLSAKQLRNRERFILVEGFLNPLSDFLKESFTIFHQNKSPRNVASSWNNPTAVDDTEETQKLIYNKVLLSQGILREPQQAVIQLDAPGVATVSWKDNSHQAMAWADDVLFVMLYVPHLKDYYYFSD